MLDVACHIKYEVTREFSASMDKSPGLALTTSGSGNAAIEGTGALSPMSAEKAAAQAGTSGNLSHFPSEGK